VAFHQGRLLAAQMGESGVEDRTTRRGRSWGRPPRRIRARKDDLLHAADSVPRSASGGRPRTSPTTRAVRRKSRSRMSA
jgi:hypothetical protein